MLRIGAVAAAALLAACAGVEQKTSRDRADAESSGASRIVYVEAGESVYCPPCDDSTVTCDTVCYVVYSWSNLRIRYEDGTDGGTVPGGDFGVQPAWSPDETRIAFIGSDGEIHVADLAAQTERKLTNSGWDPWGPTWSPDGGEIAFGMVGSIYVMNATDGSGVTSLGSFQAVWRGRIDWSRDGSTIAFDCTAEPNNYDICTIKADGTTTTATRLTSDTGRDHGAAWSASGQLAFSTERFGNGPELAVMNADGSNVRAVGAGIAGEWPTWSPDGGRLAFVGHHDGCKSTSDSCIHVVDLDGVNVSLFADPGDLGWVADPAWTRGSAGSPPPPPPPDQPPVAQFTSSCSGLVCTFDSSGSTDDHGIAARAWDFGDGATAGDVVAPAHQYAAAGTYQVTLTVTDGAGQSASTTQPVTVADAPPVARFTYGCTGKQCTFDATSSTDDVGIVSYVWDLGKRNNATASGAVVTTSYPRSGSYNVKLTVTDTAGQTSSAMQTISVQ